MTTRPVFLPSPGRTLAREENVEFLWSPGFAASQKRKNVEALHKEAKLLLHKEAKLLDVDKTILEVSTRSSEQLGRDLSAFNLMVKVEERSATVSVEAAFQSSKVFKEAGLQSHLLDLADGREIKRRIRSLGDQELIGFKYDSEPWPLYPPTAMYDYIYLKALTQLVSKQRQLEKRIMAFDAFTDIEFNPKKSLSCQARTCALFSGLGGLVPVRSLLKDPKKFREKLEKSGYGPKAPPQLPPVPKALFP